MITAGRLRELLTYDPDTGEFRWRVNRYSGGGNKIQAKAGDVAGSNDKRGYRVIGIDGRLYFAHRLAWLYMTGLWPVAYVDHADMNKNNNRWYNLRAATKSQNGANRIWKNRTGLKGASFNKRTGKFQSEIRINGDRIYLGAFDTAEEAHAIYAEAAAVAFEEFARAK